MMVTVPLLFVAVLLMHQGSCHDLATFDVHLAPAGEMLLFTTNVSSGVGFATLGVTGLIPGSEEGALSASGFSLGSPRPAEEFFELSVGGITLEVSDLHIYVAAFRGVAAPALYSVYSSLDNYSVPFMNISVAQAVSDFHLHLSSNGETLPPTVSVRIAAAEASSGASDIGLGLMNTAAYGRLMVRAAPAWCPRATCQHGRETLAARVDRAEVMRSVVLGEVDHGPDVGEFVCTAASTGAQSTVRCVCDCYAPPEDGTYDECAVMTQAYDGVVCTGPLNIVSSGDVSAAVMCDTVDGDVQINFPNGTVYLPRLRRVLGLFRVSQASSLAAPLLASVHGLAVVGTALVTLDLPRLHGLCGGVFQTTSNANLERVRLPAVGGGTVSVFAVHTNAVLREVDVGSVHGGPRHIHGSAITDLARVTGTSSAVRIETFRGLWGLESITPIASAQQVTLRNLGANTTEGVGNIVRAAGVGTPATNAGLLLDIWYVAAPVMVALTPGASLRELVLRNNEGVTGVQLTGSANAVKSFYVRDNAALQMIQLDAVGGAVDQLYCGWNPELREVTLRGPATSITVIDITGNSKLERVLMPSVGGGVAKRISVDSNDVLRELDIGSEHGGPSQVTGMNSNTAVIIILGHSSSSRIDHFVGLSALASVAPTAGYHSQSILLKNLGANTTEGVGNIVRAAGVGTPATNAGLLLDIWYVAAPVMVALTPGASLRELVLRNNEGVTGVQLTGSANAVKSFYVRDNAALQMIQLDAVGGAVDQLYCGWNPELREVTLRGPATSITVIDITGNSKLERVLMPSVGGGVAKRISVDSNDVLRELDIGSEHGGPVGIHGLLSGSAIVHIEGASESSRINTFVGLGNLSYVNSTDGYTQSVIAKFLGANVSALVPLLAAVRGNVSMSVSYTDYAGALELSSATALRSLEVSNMPALTSLKAPLLTSKWDIAGDTRISINPVLPDGCAIDLMTATGGVFSQASNLAGTACPS
eukprot:TRINITY_DN398_c0_g1_i1.p1 TRINITY_DN398_c0_g1~~TRINITY_DN398_c0_g1_i1.p1  ORF type:complete len:989 (+),score=252.44 TRINITY_DN398_c0_g1_i1:164-3130(+)